MAQSRNWGLWISLLAFSSSLGRDSRFDGHEEIVADPSVFVDKMHEAQESRAAGIAMGALAKGCDFSRKKHGVKELSRVDDIRLIKKLYDQMSDLNLLSTGLLSEDFASIIKNPKSAESLVESANMKDPGIGALLWVLGKKKAAPPPLQDLGLPYFDRETADENLLVSLGRFLDSLQKIGRTESEHAPASPSTEAKESVEPSVQEEQVSASPAENNMAVAIRHPASEDRSDFLLIAKRPREISPDVTAESARTLEEMEKPHRSLLCFAPRRPQPRFQLLPEGPIPPYWFPLKSKSSRETSSSRSATVHSSKSSGLASLPTEGSPEPQCPTPCRKRTAEENAKLVQYQRQLMAHEAARREATMRLCGASFPYGAVITDQGVTFARDFRPFGSGSPVEWQHPFLILSSDGPLPEETIIRLHQAAQHSGQPTRMFEAMISLAPLYRGGCTVPRPSPIRESEEAAE